MFHRLPKWGGLLLVMLLLPWMSFFWLAAPHLNNCQCCHSGVDGSKGNCCGEQSRGRMSPQCCLMPFLPLAQPGLPHWQASPCPPTRVNVAPNLFPPDIYRPPEIS